MNSNDKSYSDGWRSLLKRIFLNRVLLVLLWELLFHISLLPQPAAGMNLLQLSNRVTSVKPRGPAAFRTLLPVVPRASRRRHKAINYEEIYKYYLDFMVAYSISQRWDGIRLYLPDKSDSKLCSVFQVYLLKNAGVTSVCVDSVSTPGDVSSPSVGRNRPEIPRNRKQVVETWMGRQPLIVCHFLINPNDTQPRRVNVHPRYFLGQGVARPVEILVISSSYHLAERVIEEIQPEINANYKWTLASGRSPTTKEGDKTSGRMRIVEIYGIVNSDIPIRNPVGSWSYNTGMSLDSHKLSGPTNFHGVSLRITTYEGPPLVYVDKLVSGIMGRGYLPDILEIISAGLNFKHTLSRPPDNSFGTRELNGTWSGMVGVLQRKEAELALMSFSYTDKRKEVMDFSPPVEYSANRLLIRRDWHNNELKWAAYSDPFQWQVWLAIPWTILLGVSVFIAFRHFHFAKTTPAQSAWFLSMCFLQQGLAEHSSVRKLPCRVVLGSFWILAVVLYASYTARLTSFLAASTDTLPINSLAEAVANYNWKIGLVKGSSVPDRVRDSNIPEMVKMWSRLQHDPSGYVSGFMEGLSRTYTERFIFFTSDLIPSFVVKGNCSYTWIAGKFFPGYGYMGYAKHLPFAAAISYKVARIRETGQMRRLFKKWWGTDSTCSASGTNGKFTGMSLYETGTAFLFLISGFIIATAVMIVEIYVYIRNPPDDVLDKIKALQHASASTLNSRFSDNSLKTMTVRMPHNTQLNKADFYYPYAVVKSFFQRITTPFTQNPRLQGTNQHFSIHF